MAEEKKVKRPAKRKPAAKKTTVVKKKRTVKKPTNKKKSVKKKVAVTEQPFVMPDIILPEPIRLHATSGEQSVASRKLRKPKQPVTFQQHIIGIVAVTVVGIIAMYCITSYYFITLDYIDANNVQPLLQKPTHYLDRAFQTNAGRLTVEYPEHWEVSGIANDRITFQSVWNSEVTLDIAMLETDSSSVVQWLKDNPPSYKYFQLTTLPKELQDQTGILATADGESTGQEMMIFYRMHDRYVIVVTMTYHTETNYTEKNIEGLYSVIKSLRIE